MNPVWASRATVYTGTCPSTYCQRSQPELHKELRIPLQRPVETANTDTLPERIYLSLNVPRGARQSTEDISLQPISWWIYIYLIAWHFTAAHFMMDIYLYLIAWHFTAATFLLLQQSTSSNSFKSNVNINILKTLRASTLIFASTSPTDIIRISS